MKNFAIKRTDDPRWLLFLMHIYNEYDIDIRSEPNSFKYVGVDYKGDAFCTDSYIIVLKKTERVITLDRFYSSFYRAEADVSITSNGLPKDLEEALNILGRYGIELERKCEWTINGKKI